VGDINTDLVLQVGGLDGSLKSFLCKKIIVCKSKKKKKTG
jgi:hypothetical protein